jgi:hypothetical protein
LILAEIVLVIRETGLRGVHHLVEIELVTGMVVNLEVDVLPAIALYVEAPGN